jgi:hypothetical protein
MTMRKVFALLIIFSFLPAMILALSATNAVHAAGVVATITVGMEPYDVAYDFGKSEVFVTNYYFQSRGPAPPLVSDTVLVISDFYPLAAPSVSPSPGMVYQGQTSNLTSTELTTGAPPYAYQWFSEAPNASSYSPITNATSSSYSFVTSTSTAAGQLELHASGN